MEDNRKRTHELSSFCLNLTYGVNTAMKKTIGIYLVSFCFLFFLFSTVYYFSYRDLEEERQLAEGERGTVQEQTETETAEETADEQEALRAGKTDPAVVTDEMLYISQSYDLFDGLLTETILPMPEEYLGLTREELIQFLRDSGEDKSLVSFSSSRLVVRSTETVDPEDYQFLLLLEEGYLKIYYSDRRDVYMETYLTEDELPSSEIEALKHGYYVKDVGELYDYLESITS